MKYRKRIYMVLLCLVLFCQTGCSGEKIQLVLHTGFAPDEVFRIENMTGTLSEVMTYLTAMQSDYENAYGSRIWETDLKGVTLEENVKELVLAQLSQVKAMNLLAKQEGVALTQEEERKAKEAAGAYCEGLTKEERKLLNVDEKLIFQMYCEYAAANKVYYHIIKDVNPEVSDDEARTITVDHILIKTYTLDENGNKVELEKADRKAAYEKATEIWKKAKEGTPFDSLIAAYNEDSQSRYSFGKGEMNLDFETTAFQLGKGEISNIVETEYGYHIIKCITTFNQEETDVNKIKIVEKKREEIFEEKYTEFASGLTKAVNEPLWDKVSMIENEEGNRENFFSIYEEYFSNAFDYSEYTGS